MDKTDYKRPRVEMRQKNANAHLFEMLECGKDISEEDINTEIIDACEDGFALLHIACLKGKISSIDYLLRNGATINRPSEPERKTPLMLAAMFDRISVFELLLSRQADISLQDIFNQTALFYAARRGCKENVILMLEEDASLAQQQNVEGKTALMVAIEASQNLTAETLMKYAELDTQDKQGRTALMLAASFCSETTIFALLSEGANKYLTDSKGMSAFDYAKKAGRENILSALQCDDIKEVFDSTISEDNPFEMLTMQEQLRAYLIKGADPNIKNTKGYTLLHEASKSGYIDAARIILEDGGADPNIVSSDGRTALDYAVIYEYSSISDLLKSFGAKHSGQSIEVIVIDSPEHNEKDGGNALESSQQHPNIKALFACISSGGVVDHDSCSKVDLTIKIDGITLLHAACAVGNKDAAAILLDSSANIDDFSDELLTPLMYAVRSNHETIVQFLLDRGANPNVQSPETLCIALIIAVQAQQMQIIKLLLAAKADKEIKDSSGLTAIDYADKLGDQSIRTTLVWSVSCSRR